jgi:hypothetical protein
MGIPANYKVLFLQGGASAQFEMIPINLLRGQGGRRLREHRRMGEEGDQGSQEVLQRQRRRQRRRQELHLRSGKQDWKLDKDAAYVHYTANETIGGVEFHWTPQHWRRAAGRDMSSNILSKPVDVSKYGLIYAGAQKNIGPAGLTIVIVRDDLVGKAQPTPPAMLRLQDPRGCRLDVQHAADLRDLHRRPGVQVAEEAGRRGCDGASKTREGQRCFTTTRSSKFFSNPVAQGRPFAHERSLHAQAKRSTRSSSRAPKRAA